MGSRTFERSSMLGSKYYIAWGLILAGLSIGCSSKNAVTVKGNVRNTLLGRIQGQSEAQAVQTLCDIVQGDGDQELRQDAIRYLGALGPAAAIASSALTQELVSEDNAYLISDLQSALSEMGQQRSPAC